MFRDPVKYIIFTLMLKAAVLIFLIFSVEAQVEAQPDKPILISIPEQAHPSAINLLLNGLIQIDYDIDGNGVPDRFALSRPGSIHPLFYAQDANEDGHWEVIFRDVSEDGINGNEEQYLKFLPAGN